MERRGVPAELLGALLRALRGGARPPTVSARSSPGRRVRAGEAKGNQEYRILAMQDEKVREV